MGFAGSQTGALVGEWHRVRVQTLAVPDLLGQRLRAFVKADHCGDRNGGSFEVGDGASNIVRSHADCLRYTFVKSALEVLDWPFTTAIENIKADP